MVSSIGKSKDSRSTHVQQIEMESKNLAARTFNVYNLFLSLFSISYLI